MEPTQISVGTSESLAIKSEIDGITEIIISDWTAKRIGQSKLPICYSGYVKSGNVESQAVEAYVFAFRCQDCAGEAAKMLHQHCSTSYHPNVMRSLGHGKGTKDYSDYMFVAFPKFDYTFGDLLRPASNATEMGRFSEIFTKIVSDIVDRLLALDKHGFGCPNLQGGHIAIKVENGFATAKIWNYSACESREMKDSAWPQLGRMISDAAAKNFAFKDDSLEIQDLYRKMIDGQLKGLDILGHSAMLPVQKKFENVLSLWMDVSVNCAPQLVQEEGHVQNQQQQKEGAGQKDRPATSKVAYTLEEYLDLHTITSRRPDWIDKNRRTKQPKTFRALVDEMRDIIEHENEYIPKTMTEELTDSERVEGKRNSDLEHSFRMSWPKDFLKMQLRASNQTIKLH